MHSVDGEFPAAPTRVGRNNQASEGITVKKLNGQVYTPLSLARGVVARLRWPLGVEGDLVDASCGDGIFLQAAVERLVELGLSHRIGQVVGYDIDEGAVAKARARLDRVCQQHGLVERPRILHGDALTFSHPTAAFVGNPPYLEAKRMPNALKSKIKASFPISARGAFDLYATFVEIGLNWLVAGGELAVIVPNRILVTSATTTLRTTLSGAGRVAVVDLSRESVFHDAAVYPIVVHLSTDQPRGYQVQRLDGEVLAALPDTTLDQLAGRFPLPPPSLLPLLDRLLSAPDRFPPLAQHLKVRWTVSFHRGGLRDAYVFQERPDSPTARPFIGGQRYSGNREVGAYTIDWSGSWIDYDEDRARADKNPLPPLALFDQPKVAIPQNARRPRAALEGTGAVLKDTFLAAVLADNVDGDWLEWAVLVINSALFHHLYEALYGGTRKGGKYLHVLGSYLAPVPLPAPPDGVVALHAALRSDPSDADLRAQAEAMVWAAYEVSPTEAAALSALETPDA